MLAHFSRLLSARRRRLLPNCPLVIACLTLACASIWLYPSLGPASGGSERATASRGDNLTLRLKTKTRGVLDIYDSSDKRFLLVQCHRGQFSNRLKCLKLGILLARALQRVLVMPIFTDVKPVVDVSKYVSLECLRRNSLAVTFAEFREHICRAAGLEAPRPAAGGVLAPAPGSMIADVQHGAFCQDSAVLQLQTGFSLADYRGYNCWNRREDLTNAGDLGISVSGCTHLEPGLAGYSLADIRRHFAGRREQVLLFLDLFGVDLLPSTDDLAETVSEPGQMCSWMPTEAAAAAADTVMQILIPTTTTVAVGGADDGGGLSAILDPATHQTVFKEPPQEPPPLRLRGARIYAAVHLRRSDWFYYCGGSGHCFYSLAEAAAWLNDTLAARQLDTLYVSTNADEREKMMLRRAVSGRVLYWEDALAQLRAWQADDGDAADGGGDAAASVDAPPSWLRTLPLEDELMVQMVEKAICMQAAFFISSIGSTFSSQIWHFRNGGLEDVEWGILERKFPAAVASGAPETAIMPNGGGGAAEGKMVVPIRENVMWLCDMRPPLYPDLKRLPDYHNPKVFLEEIGALRSRALRFWHMLTKRAAAPEAPADATAAAAAAAAVAATEPPPPRPPLAQVLLAPARAVEWLALVVEDGHAMAAANRFVDMYTGGAMLGLLVEGRLTAPAAALADCVEAAAAAAGAVSVHVTMAGVPEEQQVLLMLELEGRAALRQITRMGGPDQERGSTFTLLWRGEGLSRHPEPALLEELPTFLERADAYVLAKSRVLLGDRRGLLFRQVENLRRVFGFRDPRDGGCAAAELQDGSGGRSA